ncbi:MAG: 1-acyl-sn-glycerol-3-phosphate acyltransferase [Planctomycetes bacterium]|nr:1-acyl-sn-glycerol-3-phosphate acyltransferase [Planctomycetota bacterium]
MRLLYRVAWHVVRACMWLMGGADIRGVGNVPLEDGLIVASNHASFFDPPLVGASLPRELNYMARKTLFKNPVGRWCIETLNAFPIDRDGDSREALREFIKRLEEGKAVLMFPEGTRTVTGKMAEIQSGIGTIAVRSGSPVLPVYVWGSYQSWPKGQKIPNRHPYKIIFGEVIRPRTGLKGKDKKDEQERIRVELDAALHKLEDEAWANEPEPVPLVLKEKETAEVS